MDQLLVIGDIAFDILHLADRSLTSAGGAGLYTTVSAGRCGVEVAMIGLRPDPLPGILAPFANRLNSYTGPRVSATDLPLFELSLREQDAGFTRLRAGAGRLLTPEHLPHDLSGYGVVHVTPAAGPRWQLEMVRACRRRGARTLSAATFPCSSREAAEAVRDVIAAVDVFFMNANEATAVFGSPEDAAVAPGRLLYVTQGADGVLVFEGRQRTHLPAAPAEELDPTGAGDSFAGAVLAYLLQEYSPLAAAQRAVLLAADVVAQPGPSALFAGQSSHRSTPAGRFANRSYK